MTIDKYDQYSFDREDLKRFTLPNGKYQGKRISVVPDSYLKWMIEAEYCEDYAEAELDRRHESCTKKPFNIQDVF